MCCIYPTTCEECVASEKIVHTCESSVGNCCFRNANVHGPLRALYSRALRITSAMPAYHSAFPKDAPSVCGLAMLSLKTRARGPAVSLDATAAAGGDEDQIDEALRLFRANVLFRNFEVQGAPDRTLIYLTLLIHQVRAAGKRGALGGGSAGAARRWPFVTRARLMAHRQAETSEQIARARDDLTLSCAAAARFVDCRPAPLSRPRSSSKRWKSARAGRRRRRSWGRWPLPCTTCRASRAGRWARC